MNLADLPQRLLGVGAPVVEAGPRIAVGAVDLVGHRFVPQVGPYPVGPATDVVLGEQPHLRARGPLVGEELSKSLEHRAQALIGHLTSPPLHLVGVTAQSRPQDLLGGVGHHRHDRLPAVEALAQVWHYPGAQALLGVVQRHRVRGVILPGRGPAGGCQICGRVRQRRGPPRRG